jgi:hypothetical protein
MIKVQTFDDTNALQKTHFITGDIRATTPPERAITLLLQASRGKRCSPEPLASPVLRVVTVEANSGLHCIGGRRITR